MFRPGSAYASSHPDPAPAARGREGGRLAGLLLGLGLGLALVGGWGCTTAAPKPPPRPIVKPAPVVVKPAPVVVKPATPETGLYTPQQALSDALAGPWEFLGTGPWRGNSRMHACAYRTPRALVVNAYCTLTDRQAIRVDIYRPQQGRVRIYAEGAAPISSRSRQEYFTFTVESEPPPPAEANLPALGLGMSFGALAYYETRRYEAYLPTCFTGEQLSRPQAGCLGRLARLEETWDAENRWFIMRANHDWYRLVRSLRRHAERHGMDPH